MARFENKIQMLTVDLSDLPLKFEEAKAKLRFFESAQNSELRRLNDEISALEGNISKRVTESIVARSEEEREKILKNVEEKKIELESIREKYSNTLLNLDRKASDRYTNVLTKLTKKSPSKFEQKKILEEISDLSPEERVVALASGVQLRQSEIENMAKAIEDLKNNEKVESEIDVKKLLNKVSSKTSEIDLDTSDEIKKLHQIIESLKREHRKQLDDLKSNSNTVKIDSLLKNSGKTMTAGSNFAEITRHYAAELVDFKSDFAQTTTRLEDDNDRKLAKSFIS